MARASAENFEVAPNPVYRRRSKWSWLVWSLLALGMFHLLVGRNLLYVAFGLNFHAVVENQCYRAGQPSPQELEKIVRDFGIRTIFNLRGTNVGTPWYEEEQQTARALGVDIVDFSMSAYTRPPRQTFQQLIRTFDQARGPILLHCWNGGDRTGLAAAFYLLLKSDASFEQAQKQLSLRFGHNPWKAKCQDEILIEYQNWLEAQSLDHAPDHFRRWLLEEYRGENDK